MSRLILIALILWTNPSLLLAQVAPTIQFGLKVGFNLARFQQTPTPVIDHFLPGYAVGLTAQRVLSTPLRLGLAADLLYSQQGSVEPVIQGVTNYDKISYRYTYLTLPLRLTYTPKSLPFQLSLGLQGGYTLQAVRKLHLLPGYPAFNTAPYDAFLKKIDLGWLASLAYPMSHHFQLEVKYYRSLSPLTRNYNGYDPTTGQYLQLERMYNQLLSGSLSYYFK